jgi:adenosylmethionine-8-amino-7-oxononanoate aminotransferase
MPGALWVTNWNSYRTPYEGSLKDVAIKCANEFEAVILHQGPDTVAAMIAEPISTATGIQVPPPEYFQRLREIADKYGVLLIADEVITGFGRLGTYFGPENWGVQPDLTTVAKALTSGYAPLGAVIATKKVADVFLGGERETFKHLITFGGHPVAAAAGLANLQIFEREDLVGNSRRMGTYLYEQLQGLKKHKVVGDVRGGLGLLAAVELVQDRAAKKSFPREAGLGKKLPKMLYDRKVVSFRAADVIAMCPPLSITKDEVDFLVSALDDSIGRLQSELGVS